MNTSTTARLFQVFSPLLVLFIHGLIYNPIGKFAALRGVDFSPLINTWLDTLVPYVPIFVLPYLFIWFFPVVLMVGIYRQLGMHQPGPYLRLSWSILALMGISYAIWIILPARFDLRVAESVLNQGGILGELIRLNYDVASLWNNFPSFHVACPWFLYRALRYYVPGRHLVFFLLSLSIMASTVFIRIHYLADIVGGILVSELVFWLVLHRLEQADRQIEIK